MPRLYVLTLLAACGSGGGFPDARPIDAAPPRGTFTLSWAVTDTNGNPISCDQIGAQSVTVLAHNLGEVGGGTQVFVCSTLSGTSEAITPGQYEFMFELDGQASAKLASSPDQRPIEVPEGGTVALSPLSFAVNATGNLALNLSTGRTKNCAPAAATTGAGITATTLTLTHNSDGSCSAPVTLNISASTLTPANTATTYAMNVCDVPVNGPCIESDQQITATGVASGDYTIHVKGIEGTTAMPAVGPVCWTNNDSITIPPLAATLTRTLNLGFQMQTAGCI